MAESETTRATAVTWDPAQYARYAGPRSRPFFDLVAQVQTPAQSPQPREVVDLGCGDGPLTLSLADRWPQAHIVGIDSSSQMLEQARSLDGQGRVTWVQQDIATWRPPTDAPIDVIVSNAALQWVPDHLGLLPAWVDALAPGGQIAIQVPGNFDAPSHVLMREVAARQPDADAILGALQRALSVPAVADYLETLTGLGLEVDAWETTYQHVLDPAGVVDNPVLDWVRGTGLRPAIAAIEDPQRRARYLEEYASAVQSAYPRRPFGVLLPFRRTFCVARRGD